MEASEAVAVEYTSDGEISEQMSGTVTHSLRKLGKQKINILLMGRGSSGKTSMRSVIFDNYKPIDTSRLCATHQVETTHVQTIGNVLLNIKDCGGQEQFFNNHFGNKRKNIFHNVEILIYVFDVKNRDEELAKDLNYYQTCLSAICDHSPAAKVFCLIHKMDLIAQDHREKLFEDRENDLINISKPLNITCFMTSIWNDSLYKAWSSIIVYRLIPNTQKPEEILSKFVFSMECNEFQGDVNVVRDGDVRHNKNLLYYKNLQLKVGVNYLNMIIYHIMSEICNLRSAVVIDDSLSK